MKDLIIGFSKPSNSKFPIFSYLIRLLQGTEYSHVFIAWKSDSLQRTLVYQASGLSVNFTSFENFKKKVKIIHTYTLSIPSELDIKIKQKAIDNSNKPYGIKQVLGLGIVALFDMFGRDISNPFSDGRATYVCSELVADLLIEFGITLTKSLDNITPKDLKIMLDNNHILMSLRKDLKC